MSTAEKESDQTGDPSNKSGDEDHALNKEVEYHMRSHKHDICLCKLYGRWPRVKACPACGEGGTKTVRRHRSRAGVEIDVPQSVALENTGTPSLAGTGNQTHERSNPNNDVNIPSGVFDVTNTNTKAGIETSLDIHAKHGSPKIRNKPLGVNPEHLQGVQDTKSDKVNQVSSAATTRPKLVKPTLIPAAEFIKKYYYVDPTVIPPQTRIPFRLLLARAKIDVVVLTEEFKQLCDLYDVELIVD